MTNTPDGGVAVMVDAGFDDSAATAFASVLKSSIPVSTLTVKNGALWHHMLGHGSVTVTVAC